MRVVDITWTIGPVFRHEGSALSWVDFAAVLGIGGLWLFCSSGIWPAARCAGEGSVLQGSDGPWRTLNITHAPSPAPVEGDGISYSGIVWFVVVLTSPRVACQLLMWVLLLAFQHQAAASPRRPRRSRPRSPSVRRRSAACIRTCSPSGCRTARSRGCSWTSRPTWPISAAHEHAMLTTYGWVDQSAGACGSRSSARRSWSSSAGCRCAEPTPAPSREGSEEVTHGTLSPIPNARAAALWLTARRWLVVCAGARAWQPQRPAARPCRRPERRPPNRFRCSRKSASIRSSTRSCRSMPSSPTRPASRSRSASTSARGRWCWRSCTTSARCSARRCSTGWPDRCRACRSRPARSSTSLVVSFDPGETPAMAAERKQDFVRRYIRDARAQNVHFLTGPRGVDQGADVGGRLPLRLRRGDRSVRASGGDHARSRPRARVSRYLYGIEFAPRDLKLALVEASEGKIGSRRRADAAVLLPLRSGDGQVRPRRS